MLQAGLYHYVALPVIKIRWIVIGKLMLQAGLNHYVALPVIKIRWVFIQCLVKFSFLFKKYNIYSTISFVFQKTL
jgi:hypothetical protein